MQRILGLARLALDRSWAVGLLLIVLCGSVLLASAHGTAISLTVMEWANAGVLFGFACIVVTSMVHLGNVTMAFTKQKMDAARERRFVRCPICNGWIDRRDLAQAVGAERLLVQCQRPPEERLGLAVAAPFVASGRRRAVAWCRRRSRRSGRPGD